MKTALFFLGVFVASPINFLLLNKALDKNESSNDDYLRMMLLSPGLLGKSQTQACQIDPILPYMLMNSDNAENSKIIMMLMLENPNTPLDNILPYFMLENGKIDMESLFLVTTVMQTNCKNTNDQLNMLLSLLLLRNDGKEHDRRKRETAEPSINEGLKILILTQTMSEGNNGLDINFIMPYLLLNDARDEDNLLLMILMNAISGELDSEDGFGDNFNLLLPLLLEPKDSKFDSDMLYILMAMQSQAPSSGVSSNTLLPLLLIDTESNNEQLIFFMAMMNNKKCDQPISQRPIVNLKTPIAQNVDVKNSRLNSQNSLVLEPLQLPIQPIKSVVNVPTPAKTIHPEVEEVYRTWRVNLDGSRILVDSNSSNSSYEIPNQAEFEVTENY